MSAKRLMTPTDDHSGICKLTRQLFYLALGRNLIIDSLLFALTWTLLLLNTQGANSLLAYETLINLAAIPYLFIASLLAGILVNAFGNYLDHERRHGIYTTMMLPMPRWQVGLAYGLAAILQVLLLWTTQVVALLSAYRPVVAICERAARQYVAMQGWQLPFSVERSNGLFLAFLRSDFLRILLPFHWTEAIGSLLILLLAGALPVIGLGLPVARKSINGFLLLAGLASIFAAFYMRYQIQSGTGYLQIQYPAYYPMSLLALAAILITLLVLSVMRLNAGASEGVFS